MLTVNRNRALMQQFAAQAVEYSRRNPQILPILESVGIRPISPRTNQPATTAE